tara:strand:- start:1467 stop:1685 length:219 start_codon:yes stop_codon:yes gene_type:complete
MKLSDIIYRVLVHPKMFSKRQGNFLEFNASGGIVRCPKRLGEKILSSLAKKNYKLTRELIDIYKEQFVTNLS